MKNKKLIAISLTLGIVASALSPIYISFAKENMEAIKEPIKNMIAAKGTHETNSNVQKRENDTSLPKGTETIEQQPKEREGNIIYRSTKTHSGDKPKSTEDLYNFNQSDIQEMMKKGCTLEDIFKADEIGNKILEDPKKLLERKLNEKKGLEEIESAVNEERKKESLKQLKEKYSKEYDKISKEKLNEDEQFEILSFVDINEVDSIDALIKEYKKNGEEVLKQKAKAKQPKITNSKMKEAGIAEDETGDLSDEILDRLTAISRETGVPVKELAKGYTNEKEKMKEARK